MGNYKRMSNTDIDIPGPLSPHPILLILNSNKITGSVSNYTLWNIWSKHFKVTCFPGRNKNTWSHFFVSHSLRATGWCKAALSRPRWNPSGELGLQHFWPEELYPGCSFTFCVRAHSSRGHGLPQYRGAPAGAPQWPAGPVPSPRWGLWFWIMWFYKQCTAVGFYIIMFSTNHTM